jgi:hypothetical protein
MIYSVNWHKVIAKVQKTNIRSNLVGGKNFMGVDKIPLVDS